jgi:hypothetical protein
VAETFHELYSSLLKDVFAQRARQQVEQGADGLALARAYAEQGKPDFALAYLLLIDLPDEEKRAALAQAYEERARRSEEKAAQLQIQFHRSFPLIKLDARRDRAVASAIRRGERIDVTGRASDAGGGDDTGKGGGEGDHKGPPLP